MRSFIIAPLATSCIALGCGKSEPAPAPTPAAVPAPSPSPTPEPAPSPSPTPEPAPSPSPTPEPSPTAAPTPTTCNSPHIVVSDQAGTAVGSYSAAVKHATGAAVDSAAAAKEMLAKTYAVFLDSPLALVTHIEQGVENPTTNLYALGLGDEGFVAFVDFHSKLAEYLTVATTLTGADRYLVVSVEEEYHERVTSCLDGEVDEEDCELTATGDAGGDFAHYVVDREARKIVFRYGYGREANTGCDKAAAPTFADGKWSAKDCEGKAETFALADIVPCTRAVQEKRMAEDAEAKRKKDEAQARAAAAKRLPDAEVEALINQGRKATTDKKLDEAIAVFDRVIDTNPDAIRAHSGRAFALLQRAQEGDLEAAETGFDAAYQLTKRYGADNDPKLRSQIMFNRGLVAEKRGDAELAKRFFQKAHDLSPSDATRKKLGE